MGLLQDPLKALEQAEHYLDNQAEEKFPGAAVLSAGTLCRQTLEQILFILCFYSRMPQNRYLRDDRSLKVAGQLLTELGRKDTATGRTFWKLARARGPRIRKFARQPRVLKAWQKKLNEAAHFTVQNRTVDTDFLRGFIGKMRPQFDAKDINLIIAAINELFSGGRVTATLSDDADNIVGVQRKVVVTADMLDLENGNLTLRTNEDAFLVISNTEVPKGPWPKRLVLPTDCDGMQISAQFVTRKGEPVDLRTFGTILSSLGRTKGQRAAVTRRTKQLGLEVKWEKIKAEK
jgi:hypothetical protein